MESKPHGLIDNWLRHIKDVYDIHDEYLNGIADPDERADRFCELNVASQVSSLGSTTIVQDAWRRGQKLTIHGWIYGLENGHLKDLDLCISKNEDLPNIYRMDPAATA